MLFKPGADYQKKPEDSIFENGDEWRLFVSLKICCGKNLRTDFAIYGGVGDFANFYDWLLLRRHYVI